MKLFYDLEQHDRHGRKLAHLFTPERVNVQAKLLARGFATPLVIPPNLAFLSCYQLHTAEARVQKSGLWAQPEFQPKKASNLTKQEKGYRIVEGKVMRMGESRSAVWLNMDNNLDIRILRGDLIYFDKLPPKSLIGSTLRVRGRVYEYQHRLQMRIRHPADLTVIASKSNGG